MTRRSSEDLTRGGVGGASDGRQQAHGIASAQARRPSAHDHQRALVPLDRSETKAVAREARWSRSRSRRAPRRLVESESAEARRAATCLPTSDPRQTYLGRSSSTGKVRFVTV